MRFTREYLLTVTPDRGSKNSILNWVLKQNLVQRNLFNPNLISVFNNVLILHIACISPASSLKIFVFIKFRGCFLLCGSALDPFADFQRARLPRPPASALTQSCFKNSSGFFLKNRPWYDQEYWLHAINPCTIQIMTSPQILWYFFTVAVLFHNCIRFRISTRSIRNIRTGVELSYVSFPPYRTNEYIKIIISML